MFEELLQAPAHSHRQESKEALLLPELNDLVRYHYERCAPYARMIDAAWGGPRRYERLEDIPFLPVGLFKKLELSSTDAPLMTLRSSGTSGQVPSRIVVDKATAARQSQALVSTFRSILGERRQPFLVIDTKDVLKPGDLSARGAGVLGMMKFGANATFALDSELDLQRDTLLSFIEKYQGQPFLIFGFTFLVWSRLYQMCVDGEFDLSNGILVHSGGWKSLEEQKVSNPDFRAALGRRFGLRNICNFYGFVEQIGSVFTEGEDGLLHPPNFTDIIVRRPGDWQPAAPGEEGVVQTLSLLPLSYPGHSILTEDRGVIVEVDSGIGGRFGKAVRITGRVARAELRGCSDVVAATTRAMR